MKKLAAALALVVASQTVYADAIPTDISYNDGTNTSNANVLITELNFNYQSNSIITDADNNQFISNGDTISSIGGAELHNGGGAEFTLAELTAGLDFNYITGTVPASAIGPGYGIFGDWMMTFALSGLEGTFNNGVFDYTAGEITVFGLYASLGGGAWDSFGELFTISISNTITEPGDIHYTGSITDVVGDYFTQAHTGDTFGQTLAKAGDTTYVDIDQNAFGANFGNGIFGAPGGTINTGVTGHDGTIVFSVPEPTSIAILGLGLLGLAGSARRRNA